MTRRPTTWYAGLRLALILASLLAALAAPTAPVTAGAGTTDSRGDAWAGPARVAPPLGTPERPLCWPPAGDRLVCGENTPGFQAASNTPAA